MKFRTIPVVVEAMLYTGQNLAAVIQFTGKHPKWDTWFESWDDYVSHVDKSGGIFRILTSYGTMDAEPGDCIIEGAEGEFYPCKPDVFKMTYEKV